MLPDSHPPTPDNPLSCFPSPRRHPSAPCAKLGGSRGRGTSIPSPSADEFRCSSSYARMRSRRDWT
ncbi:hypothetical protein B0H19DRAFT_1151894 [Mycena capillaripes]|nr:hypothetical protein B0H19DRAFT_1151894 [Mycena capillaripes]